MRRTLLVLPFAAVAVIAIGLALRPDALPAQQGKPPADPFAPARAQPAPLPINKVILFTSGVAYFQREATIDGNANRDLSFPVRDINDLLKTLVLRDHGGGEIHAVGYDSHEPIDRTLRSFAVNLNDNPTYAQILNQARGERVEVIAQRPGGKQETLKGSVLGVEQQHQPVARDAVAVVQLLNLWSDDGMRSVKLSEVAHVRFLNPVLDSEMKRALDVVARAHDRDKKTISFNFTGQGKRRVEVGYVVEHPIWRTSYRLVLKAKGKPFLQGWAMVENPTAEDWHDVSVRLVSGRPISFRMDLYQPLYVNRPLVELETYASLRPRVYEGWMRKDELARMPVDKKEDAKDKEKVPSEMPPGIQPPSFQPPGLQPPGTVPPPREDLDVGRSVPTAARGQQEGASFQYVLKDPLSLARQKSALLPIVNNEVQGERVSIFTAGTGVFHPLLGVRLKNTTGLHLMQGPIAVFDGGSYAGDALIRDLQPGESRLLSYAVDQAVEVKVEGGKSSELLIAVRIDKGIVEQRVKLQQTTTYQIKSRAEEARVLLLEHPVGAPAWKLVIPEGKQTQTRSHYQFVVKLPAGAAQDYPVIEEQQVLQHTALTNIDDGTVAVLLQSKAASPALKAKLRQAAELKGKVSKTQAEIGLLQGRLRTTIEDQVRQRENLKVIPQTDPAYRKSLDRFLATEGQIEKMRAENERLQAIALQQRQEYDAFLANLTVKE
jgi:hypothetical protein